MGFKAQPQGRNAGENAVLVAGHVQQHHCQCGLVKVLHVVGRNANTDRARPIGDRGQGAAQGFQNFFGRCSVVVGDVEQGQGGRLRVVGLRHLRLQLRKHQAAGHLPLRMRSVGVRKKGHA